MSDWRPTASAQTLKARAHIFAQLRAFFASRDVIEVHTPLLGSATVTDPDVPAIHVPDHGFLQTSAEYYLKRLLAYGVGDCYQLAPVFRRDESGRLHRPEFTMLEWYRLGFDDVQLMQEVGELVDTVLGAQPYVTKTYAQVVGREALNLPRDELDLTFAAACEALSGRVFITDYPVDQAVLARTRPDNPQVSARFELVIDGIEIANGYWELTDAEEHRRRFAIDLQQRSARGLEDVQADEKFLLAIEHGLPDCAGVALGVDRLVMLALGLSAVSEALPFADG